MIDVVKLNVLASATSTSAPALPPAPAPQPLPRTSPGPNDLRRSLLRCTATSTGHPVLDIQFSSASPTAASPTPGLFRSSRDPQPWIHPSCDNDRPLRGTAPAPDPTGEHSRRPPTIARSQEIRAHLIRCRAPGYRADPVRVQTTPARPGAHTTALRQPIAIAGTGAAFRLVPTPHRDGTTAPRGAWPRRTRLTRTWTGERSRRPPTIARSPEISFHMISCRVPGHRADPVRVQTTPARPGAHTTALRQPNTIAGAGAAFRLVPTPHRDGTTAPAARGPDALAARGLGPGSALDGLPPSPARQKFVPHDPMPHARPPRRPATPIRPGSHARTRTRMASESP